MDKTALDVIAQCIRDLVADDADVQAGHFVAALGANGYVVVPRHLLDELLEAAKPGDDMRRLMPFTSGRLGRVRAAVVEAVGPTAAHVVKCPACPHAEFRHTNGCEVCDCRLTFRAVGPTKEGKQ